jgi:hypothetical protein
MVETMEHNRILGHYMNEYAKMLQDPAAARRRRKLKVQNNEQRALQTPERQKLVFEGCLWYDNSSGPKTGSTNYGLIFAETAYNDIVVIGNTIARNSFGDPADTLEGYAINIVQGSTLQIENTCLIDNDFIGPGSIIMQSADDLVGDVDNYATSDPDAICDWVAIVPEGGDNQNPQCIEAGSDTCLNDLSLPPESAPTEPTSPQPVPTEPPAPPTTTSEPTATGTNSTEPPATNATEPPTASPVAVPAVVPTESPVAVSNPTQPTAPLTGPTADQPTSGGGARHHASRALGFLIASAAALLSW